MANQIAGWFVFFQIWLHFAMIVGPIAAGTIQVSVQPMNCPRLVISHGVGSDLRTWVKARDLCGDTD